MNVCSKNSTIFYYYDVTEFTLKQLLFHSMFLTDGLHGSKSTSE